VYDCEYCAPRASDCNANYRLVLSSERASYAKKQVIVRQKEKINLKSDDGPQRGARRRFKSQEKHNRA
jgi:hypothetical protein